MSILKVRPKAIEARKLAVTPTNSNSPLPIYNLLSFFSGAGFLDLGFHRAGFNSVWHNELSPEFTMGFEMGMDGAGVLGAAASIQNSASLESLGPNQIIAESFGSLGKPDFFGMIGGPPCPDFSVGGKNRGSSGDNGKLSEIYVNRVLEISPSFFLFENVPGLLRTEKHREFFETLVSRLGERYLLDLKILNSLDYGVPQDRERVFLVGIDRKHLYRKGYRKIAKQIPRQLLANVLADRRLEKSMFRDSDSHWFPWDVGLKYPKAKSRYNWPITCPFGSTPNFPDECPLELMVGPLISDQSLIQSLPNGSEGFQAYSSKFFLIDEGDVSRKSFKRLHRWRYSPAAAYGNNEVHLHPIEPRRLTVRECLRLQTVPDKFVLPSEMSLTAKFKTIGNGVPVRLAEAVALSFREVFMMVEKGSLNVPIFRS